MRFEDLNLVPPLLQALAECGYAEPTPIQAQTIPVLLEGRDVIASAQTGTGKTAAFILPALQRLAAQGPRAPSKRRGVGVPRRARARADARTGAAGRHPVGALRPESAAAHRLRIRRCAVSAAEPRDSSAASTCWSRHPAA